MEYRQKGFAALEAFLILIILAIIGGTGWYVFKVRNNVYSVYSSTNNITSTSRSETLNKIYTNSEYGFSFRYPAAWKLTVDLSQGRGAQEGDVYVESPSGTKVHFSPDQGGKGGGCLDNCQTRQIYSVEKLSSSPNDVYFVKVSDTEPTVYGGGTTYFVALLTNNYDANGELTLPPKVGSDIGVYMGAHDDVYTYGKHPGGCVTVWVEGKDDSKNNSIAFFDTAEVKEATPILKSFILN